MQQITAPELAAWLADAGREIATGKDIVAICHHGGRSQQVAVFLEKNGYNKVHNLVGGVDAWSRTVDPAVPLY